MRGDAMTKAQNAGASLVTRREATAAVAGARLGTVSAFGLADRAEAADLRRRPVNKGNLSELADGPACSVPARRPLPRVAIAPATNVGTASSGLGTIEAVMADLIPAPPMPTVLVSVSRPQPRMLREA